MKYLNLEMEITGVLLAVVALYHYIEWVMWVALAFYLIGVVLGIIDLYMNAKADRKLKIVTAQAESELVGRMSKALAVAYKALHIVCKGENEIDTDEKVITLLEQAEKELNEND